MQDQPVQIDRAQVLKDAEAALVAHRVYFSRRLAAIPSGTAPIEEVERWRQEWPQQLTSETEVVVDTVIQSITTSTVLLTSEEAGACQWALDHLILKHSYDGLRARDGSRVDLRALAEKLEAR